MGRVSGLPGVYDSSMNARGKFRQEQNYDTEPGPVKRYSRTEIAGLNNEPKQEEGERLMSKRNTEIKKNILDALLTHPDNKELTLPVITEDVALLMNIENDSSLRAHVFRIFEKLEVLGGLERSAGYSYNGALCWLKKLSFADHEQTLRTEIVELKRPVKILNNNIQDITVKEFVIRTIYAYPKKIFTIKKIFAWSEFPENLSKLTFKDYAYKLFVEEGYLKKYKGRAFGKQMTFEKTEKLLRECKEHFEEVTKDETELTPITGASDEASGIEDSGMDSFIGQINEMGMEEKLKHLNLSPTDIGNVILETIASLQEKASKTEELEEERIQIEYDYELTMKLQSTVNELKMENTRLSKELSQERVKVMTKTVDNKDDKETINKLRKDHATKTNELNRIINSMNKEITELENQIKGYNATKGTTLYNLADLGGVKIEKNKKYKKNKRY